MTDRKNGAPVPSGLPTGVAAAPGWTATTGWRAQPGGRERAAEVGQDLDLADRHRAVVDLGLELADPAARSLAGGFAGGYTDLGERTEGRRGRRAGFPGFMGQHFDRMLALTRGAFGRSGVFAENWMPVEQDPAFKPLLKKHRQCLPKFYEEEIDRLPEDEREKGRIEAAMKAARNDTQQLRGMALIDVMGVVMGVAGAADRVEEAIPRLQEFADRMFETDTGPWPEFGKHVQDIPAVHVAVEFANLLKWTRDILERLERPDGGLLPAMAPRLYARVVPLQGAFEKIAERLLANYTLHGGLVVQPFEGAQVMKDGRVVMRVPDRPDARVPSRFHLEYQEGRDVLTVSREIVKATEVLVKGLCAAFAAEDQAIEADRRAAGLWHGA